MHQDISCAECEMDKVDLGKFSTFLSFMNSLLFVSCFRDGWPPRIQNLLRSLRLKINTDAQPEKWSRKLVDNVVEGAFLMLPDDYYTTRLKRVFHYANEENPDKDKWKTCVLSFVSVAAMLGRHSRDELTKILAHGSAETTDVAACLQYWGQRTTWSEGFSALPDPLDLTEVKEWAESQLEVLRQVEESVRSWLYSSVNVEGQTLLLDFSSGPSAAERTRWVTIEVRFGGTPTTCVVSWSANQNKPSQSLSVERLLAQLSEDDYRAES